MKFIAEKRTTEMSESNIVILKTVYEVIPGETVEGLLKRVGLTGASPWHFNECEVRIKLVNPSPLTDCRGSGGSLRRHGGCKDNKQSKFKEEIKC
jgi:hypothetical protein